MFFNAFYYLPWFTTIDEDLTSLTFPFLKFLGYVFLYVYYKRLRCISYSMMSYFYCNKTILIALFDLCETNGVLLDAEACIGLFSSEAY